MKKIIILLITLFFTNTAFAENFYIEDYNVNLNVNEDKSVNVTEDIQVYFTSPSHGIYRKIPYKNADISNIRVNKEFTRSISNSELNLRIGNPDIMVKGAQNYRISYNYNIFDNENEFYFNIIGTEWPVIIKHAAFNVTMPKDFDFSKAGLSIGKYGTAGFVDRAVYSKKGNILYGETTELLKAREGITLRIEVPEGYFIGAKNTKKQNTIIGIIILTLIPFLIWFKYGKDEHVTPVVTFYPPKEINSIEAELVFKEKASTRGLVALLIELADKGYIQIDDRPQDNNFSITKVKEYDGQNRIEKLFLEALFKNSQSSVSLKTLETSSTFYRRCEEIITLCNKNRSSYFEKSSLSFINKFIVTSCLFGLFILTLSAAANYNFYINPDNYILFLFPIFAIFMLCVKQFHPFLIIWALGFGGIPLSILCMEFGLNTKELPVICTGITGIIISLICLKQMAKKNRLGQQVLSQLLGLKKFIEVAEKHRLESLVKENPSYFYNILPYAYILGVSDKWIKQLESIMTANPDWYRGSRFNTDRFNRFTSKMHSVSIPSTANGGIQTSSSSGGGGGFSGGGHGGGGGGSW